LYAASSSPTPASVDSAERRRQVAEDGRRLQRADDSVEDAVARAEPRHGRAAPDDVAPIRAEGAGQQPEHRRLPRPVGAEQRVDLAGMDVDVDVVGSGERSVVLRQAAPRQRT
jgi:hypothetical protein